MVSVSRAVGPAKAIHDNNAPVAGDIMISFAPGGICGEIRLGRINSDTFAGGTATIEVKADNRNDRVRGRASDCRDVGMIGRTPLPVTGPLFFQILRRRTRVPWRPVVEPFGPKSQLKPIPRP